VAIDDGLAVDYTAVERGTMVYDSNEAEAGKIVEVLDNAREHIFDGVVVETQDGSRHFVDAPEVARTAERGVTLSITAEEVRRLPPPDTGSGPRGFLSRLLGR
jgi:uncharacterized protein with ATP-grasp and redox domains